MKIKRYQAPDMRSALRLIREQLGADAVILSNKTLEDGVEVCAAADMESLLRAEDQLEALAAGARTAAPRTGPDSRAAPASRSGDEPRSMPPAASSGFTVPATAGELGSELRQLRLLLEQQLAALAWNDYTRREPERAAALADFARLGLARDVAASIVTSMPATIERELSQPLHLALLARRIPTCAAPLERGGVFAFVGPPGAGKTTVLAKLAARWAREHGREGLALISADEERLGAGEQLRTFGRLIGVETAAVGSRRELAARVAAFAGKQLVLIDTPGLVPGDAASGITGMRSDIDGLGVLLVLPASAQAGVLDATLLAASALSPECAVLGHCDAASSLGGALSACIRARLPIALLSTGNRIPEDLVPARGQQLLERALALAERAGATADEDLLSRRHGGLSHAA